MKKQIWEESINTLFSHFKSSENGISPSEAEERLKTYGPNELIVEKKKSGIRVFFEQFKDFLVITLICAAVISAFLGDIESSAVIFVVITMNAILGTIQTIKAQSALDSLKKMSAPTAKVIRNGTVTQIPSSLVTVGDIVLVEAGDAICADGRIIENASLKCDESALTGESIPVEKQIDEIEGTVPLGDRRNMVFSGSFVTYGRGKFLVTATGMDSEMGKIASLLKSTQEKKTPLQVSLDSFGQKLTIIIIVLCAILFSVNVFLRGDDVINSFLFAVALAVAAIPEALSSIVTIVLSISTGKMAKENAIIRKLQAVEGLGSVSVICSDKTGTLTQNKMTVKKLYTSGKIYNAQDADLSSPALNDLIRSAILCSDAVITDQGEIGDPTETALIRLGRNNNFNEEIVRSEFPRMGEIPFDSDRKLMTTVHAFPQGSLLITKGAVDVLLSRCILTKEERKEIEKVNEDFSNLGLRVLAFACKGTDKIAVSTDDENNLSFLGLIAMIDPPREESKAAVAECIKSGIRPIMITGDHKITASAIAGDIGILTPDTIAVEGSAIDAMTDDELIDFVPKVSVYARVSPEHKIRIVRAWQQSGNIVAMTGDGVNDAPALKQADIGIAMGITGTSVAKDASSMVLADDNFATIVKAVNNGRNVYANIKKSISFLLSGNTAGILAVLYCSLLALPVPFDAVHLLFINLLTDSLPAISLGLEPHTDDVMNQKPRPRTEGILTKPFLINILTEGIVMAVATIIAFHFGLMHNPETASTMAFGTLCLSRLFHGFSSKNTHPVIFTKSMWNNNALTGSFIFGFVLLLSALTIPSLKPLLHTANISVISLFVIFILSLSSMLVIQLIKTIKSRFLLKFQR